MHQVLIVNWWWIWFQLWAGIFTSIGGFWRLFQRKTTSRKEMNDNREWKFSLPSSSSFSQSGLPTPKGPFWARNVTTHTHTHMEGSQRRCEDSRRLRSHRTERWVSRGDAASTAPELTRWPHWADAMWWARTTRLPGTTTNCTSGCKQDCAGLQDGPWHESLHCVAHVDTTHWPDNIKFIVWKLPRQTVLVRVEIKYSHDVCSVCCFSLF